MKLSAGVLSRVAFRSNIGSRSLRYGGRIDYRIGGDSGSRWRQDLVTTVAFQFGVTADECKLRLTMTVQAESTVFESRDSVALLTLIGVGRAPELTGMRVCVAGRAG